MNAIQKRYCIVLWLQNTPQCNEVISAAWRWFLFGLGWKQPQIVFLDHGLYVDLPEQLRQNYCALWCSFLVDDMQTASLVGQRIAGIVAAKMRSQIRLLRFLSLTFFLALLGQQIAVAFAKMQAYCNCPENLLECSSDVF